MRTKKGINVSKATDSIRIEERLKKLAANKDRNLGAKNEELTFKDALESAGRLSYFTELFEGISLEEQQIEIEGFINPKEAYFFNKGREIAEKLVRNNIANMENYADFCKVETKAYRNRR